MDQGYYFERAHLGLGSRLGCAMGACDVLSMCDRNIIGEGVDLKGKIYQRASLELTCDQN